MTVRYKVWTQIEAWDDEGTWEGEYRNEGEPMAATDWLDTPEEAYAHQLSIATDAEREHETRHTAPACNWQGDDGGRCGWLADHPDGFCARHGGRSSATVAFTTPNDQNEQSGDEHGESDDVQQACEDLAREVYRDELGPLAVTGESDAQQVPDVGPRYDYDAQEWRESGTIEALRLAAKQAADDLELVSGPSAAKAGYTQAGARSVAEQLTRELAAYRHQLAAQGEALS